MKKRLVLLFCIMLATLTAAAQYRHMTYEEKQEAKKQEIRELINLDYSVPDYNVKKLDSNVMGWRLVKILEFLEKNYTQGLYNQLLAQIRNVQMGGYKQRYFVIDKIKIRNVQKQGDVITIKISTTSKEEEGKAKFDIILSFVNSVSDDNTTNILFCDICRYINMD